MHPKSEMLSAVTTLWILAALSCTALPFLHAVPWLREASPFAPLIAALAVGFAVGLPVSFAVRRLCGVGSPRVSWGLLAPREAALFGIFTWGVPFGLIFVLNEFLGSSDLFVAIPGIVLWPLAGIAFGLTMRWFSQRASAS